MRLGQRGVDVCMAVNFWELYNHVVLRVHWLPLLKLLGNYSIKIAVVTTTLDIKI